MITVCVLYPKTSQSRFDYGYYVDRHIPLVKSLWTQFGLTQVDLLRGVSALDGGTGGMELIGLLRFESHEGIQRALAASGAEVMADIPNFTDVQPVIELAEPIG